MKRKKRSSLALRRKNRKTPKRRVVSRLPKKISKKKPVKKIILRSRLDKKKTAMKKSVVKKKTAQRPVAKKKIVKKKTAKELHAFAAKPFSSLKKYQGNPIIRPRSNFEWESKATFNPAALYEGGKVHLLYRAIGDRDISVLGYASSYDGLHIDERLSTPAYMPRTVQEGAARRGMMPVYSFGSGGGWWGGCEDPRITRIDDTVYMLYVAFDGWSPPRVAITSINLKDFLERRFDKWTEPKIISQPPEMLKKNPKFRDMVDKNPCLLPEKVNGKYVVFHRIYPDILVDFLDDLEFEDAYLKGEYKISPRSDAWDSRKLGVGAPPLKTKEGWLLIYQGVDNKDPGRYKMGAMLLDANDPTKVLARPMEPILEPEEWYENHGWKYGVVYPCGAVIIAETLFVYYGGADSVVCVATANLPDFLKELKTHGKPKLSKVAKKKI